MGTACLRLSRADCNTHSSPPRTTNTDVSGGRHQHCSHHRRYSSCRSHIQRGSTRVNSYVMLCQRKAETDHPPDAHQLLSRLHIVVAIEHQCRQVWLHFKARKHAWMHRLVCHRQFHLHANTFKQASEVLGPAEALLVQRRVAAHCRNGHKL